MKRLLVTALALLPTTSWAHECEKFLSSGWKSDKGYACSISSEELQSRELHSLEVCIGNVPYLDGQRYAHAELKWVPLSQYNNSFSKDAGMNETFFESFYTGLAFAGQELREDAKSLKMQSFMEGSSLTHDPDIRSDLALDKRTMKARLVVQSRKAALVFQNNWETRWDLNLQCERIR
ncbi:hypothetical protein EZJ49_14000 [Bdellovibrio bacteriovorus]|uniref:hypothetical protein n=1 Tax=Bdellovibrio bacteriovorus TaxID=959 RepID=UPI0021D15A67|nr:hypothetical protein [Bdellovibrio bacteriovorus]UXR64175.1 hypothetical protein EZJ49_14000 [Bdellovibrio bacteriovorus]